MAKYKAIKMIALVTQIGISMLTPVLLMAYIGLWLQEQFEVQLALLFILMGIGAGFRNCWILIKKAVKNPEKGDGYDKETGQ